MGELEPRRPGTLATPGSHMAVQGKTSQSIVLHSPMARAYVYAGELVADCPAGCKNTEFVTGKDPRRRGKPGTRGERYAAFFCSYCGHQAPIAWPVDAEEILHVLDRRPIPHTRNWYPAGHPTAVLSGTPDGQSVEDLVVENAEHGVR